MGVFLYDDLLAVVSLRHQKVHILQIRDSGNLVDVRAIGAFCREDDELFLNSNAQASTTNFVMWIISWHLAASTFLQNFRVSVENRIDLSFGRVDLVNVYS